MNSIIHDFKSIRRKLERQEQKAEFEAKNPKVEPSMYGWPYGVAVPFVEEAAEIPADAWRNITTLTPSVRTPFKVVLSDAAVPLKSLAHPDWPYTGTPHEWPKFKI